MSAMSNVDARYRAMKKLPSAKRVALAKKHCEVMGLDWLAYHNWGVKYAVAMMEENWQNYIFKKMGV